MLARASSDAGTRLRRSKSTSTVHRHAPPVLEPLDPDIAQRHAIAAATAAFHRSHANERKPNRSLDLGRSKSTASRKSLTSQGSHFPPRELSVRSVPGHKSAQVSSSHHVSTATATEKFPSFDAALQGDRPAPDTRPLSAQPSVSFNEYTRPASQSKSHRQSAASSITSQQIRKARSMYYASSVQTGSPIARLPTKYLTTPPPVSASLALSAAPTTYVPTRSTGPSPLAGPTVTRVVSPHKKDEASRDKYLQDFQQQPRSIKHKPSLFLAPFRKRQDKSKDAAKRLSSLAVAAPPTTYSFVGDATMNISTDDFLPKIEVKDRRSFSGSLKRKIKRVFRRTSANPPSLPVQQVEASRDYFNDANLLPAGDQADVPTPHEHLLRRVQSRTPPSDSHSHPLQSASRSSSRGSNRSDRSLHSEANATNKSASRVTSWGTAASEETFTRRAMKRLTVIHEAKDSIGSMSDRPLSASTKRRSLPLPTFLAFKDPMHLESLVEEASTPRVDPKRVFSALMREIETSKSAEPSTHQSRTPGAESDVFESSKTKESHCNGSDSLSDAKQALKTLHSVERKPAICRPGSVAATSVQSKKSTVRSIGHAIRSTVRAVTPGEHKSSPCLEESDTTAKGLNTPSTGPSSRSGSDSGGRYALFKGFRSSKKNSESFGQRASLEASTPTTEQIEMRVARAKNRWQTPLNESCTPNFPRETDRLYTTVDFAQQPLLEQSVSGNERLLSLPPLQLSKMMLTPMSPSVYSRDTDGLSILPNDSVLSFNSPQEIDCAQPAGSAVILTSQSVRSYVIGTPSPNRRSSTRSSRDWKAWLSHEVSGIDTTSQEDITIHHEYTTPSVRRKHLLTKTLRSSQTESENTTVIVRKSLDQSTPRAGPGHTAVLRTEQQSTASSVSEAFPEQSETCSGCDHLNADELEKMPQNKGQIKGPLPLAPIATPVAYRDRSTSTPGSISNPKQSPLGTPTSARMNDRFPFIDTERHLSSNNSNHSHLSKSPASSVVSSSREPKSSPGQMTVYSDVSLPFTRSAATEATGTTARRPEITPKSKENITPPSGTNLIRPKISQLGLVERPKSLQPLSLTSSNKDLYTKATLSSSAVGASQLKPASSPAETIVARPSLRVTIRSLSPEKLSQRPKSAFDLRNSPSPRPASEYRRPALRSNASVLSSSGIGQLLADSEVSNHSLTDSKEQEGSVTPGQRMAERFLKERRSATVLERGAKKSPGKFVREDTPAFL